MCKRMHTRAEGSSCVTPLEIFALLKCFFGEGFFFSIDNLRRQGVALTAHPECKGRSGLVKKETPFGSATKRKDSRSQPHQPYTLQLEDGLIE